MLDIKFYKHCKSLSGIYNQMVCDLTKGNCFRYTGSELTEKKAQAEKDAREYISAQLDKIPAKVKRDLTLS